VSKLAALLKRDSGAHFLLLLGDFIGQQPHVGSRRPRMCRVARFSFARCILIRISITPSDMGYDFIDVSKRSNDTSLF
jgi:hypothetical protein